MHAQIYWTNTIVQHDTHNIIVTHTKTRLATANRSHDSIRVTKNIRRGCGEPCKKNFLASSLNTMQILVAISHVVCAHVCGPRNLGVLGASHPLIWGRG